MAIATLVGHQAYLRPEELHSLRCRDVLEPAASSGVYAFWTLLLGPLDTRKPTKTGVFDDCVILDHPQLLWIGKHLKALKARSSPDDPIWPFGRPAYHSKFMQAVQAAGLESWGVVPYSLRHSGPSWDRATRRLTLQEIQRRGRWLNERSVIRYERSARTLALLSGQPPAFLAYLHRCAKCLRAYVEGGDQGPARAGPSAATSS